MSMFCYQCQETAGNIGCRFAKGVCGKPANTANLQDLLVFNLKGIAALVKPQDVTLEIGRFINDCLFMTITNANFDDERFKAKIAEALALKESLLAKCDKKCCLPDAATWVGTPDTWHAKAEEVGVLSTENEDIRSLQELITYGLKGIAAYAHHAQALNKEDMSIYQFAVEALAATTQNLPLDKLISLTLKTGEVAVTTMATLDAANTTKYGHPELTKVNIGVGNKPGILVSGHDLTDFEQLLEQTKGTGVDVYTHSEMLPANYYPYFKKYDNIVGNYGNAWWKQDKEFASFNGPILMTTNCIVPVKDTYKDRIFTTGTAGYPGVTHICADANGKKDFSKIIELAKKCQAPTGIETGEIIGGFAHHQVMALADKVVDAVKSGAVKRFVVMAGCDARQPKRSYFTDVANELPVDTIILTAGCAKYRYNKLNLGDIGGIPRVLDAGQCNDSYSLAVIALKLKEVFELEDINDLPISFDIAWYEQKAVAVLLALLHLGIKGIRLGPTLPAFLSPNVVKVLVENFNIKPIAGAKEDVDAMMAGK